MKKPSFQKKEHQNICRIDVPVVSEINAKIGKERIHYILFTLQIYKKYLKKRNLKRYFCVQIETFFLMFLVILQVFLIRFQIFRCHSISLVEFR